jgi:hypothetical protein
MRWTPKHTETLTTASWLLLAAACGATALAMLMPGLVSLVYEVVPGSRLAPLFVSRGWLLVGVGAACLLAAFDRGSRRAASLVAAAHVLGHVAAYGLSPFPGHRAFGSNSEALLLAPLAVALFTAWSRCPR